MLHFAESQGDTLRVSVAPPQEARYIQHEKIKFILQISNAQKSIRQSARRGRRINILGIWEPGVQFDYALMVGTLKASTYLQLMDWQAHIAQQHLDATRQITVIVQDNASPTSQSIDTATDSAVARARIILVFLTSLQSTDESH